jgi:RimJ/RimL family protein N-acetyltransferase
MDMEHGEASLVTERLTLSPLTPADAAGMAAVYADPAMYEFTGGSPPTAEQLHDRYTRLAVGWNHDRSTRWSNWIVRVSGTVEPIGAIQASIAADWSSAAVAWEIGVAAQGQGYAQEAAKAVVDWLVSRGTSTIEASIHPRHHASGRVASACGLVPTADRDDGEVVWRRLAPLIIPP